MIDSLSKSISDLSNNGKTKEIVKTMLSVNETTILEEFNDLSCLSRLQDDISLLMQILLIINPQIHVIWSLIEDI